MKRVLLSGSVLAGLLAGAMAPAHATTYTFADEYWLKAGTAFSTVFAGATGNAGAQGLYQETTTGGSPVITQLSTTAFNVGSGNHFNTTPVQGEFTQNDGGSAVTLSGWTSTLFNSGSSAPASFEINKVELNPAAISLQYLTGATVNSVTGVFTGTAAAFNLNSIDLSTAVGTATGYIVEGLLAGVAIYADQVCTNGNQYAVTTVGGTCGAYNPTATVPFNWSDIDTVEFGYMSGGVFQTGWPTGGTLDMTNINLSPYSAPVPEPTSITLLGLGLLGLGFIKRRSQAGQ